MYILNNIINQGPVFRPCQHCGSAALNNIQRERSPLKGYYQNRERSPLKGYYQNRERSPLKG